VKFADALALAELSDKGSLDICPVCNGSGVGVADTTCSLCNGSGGVPLASQAAQPAEADGVERPALPVEAVHAPDCEHPRAPIWMCKCPRPVFAATSKAPATDAGEVERIAKAINGPHSPVPVSSPYTLEDLRDVRWSQLTAGEKRMRRNEAEAALAALATPPAPNDDLRAALERLPVRTRIVNVDTGERGEQSVELPLQLRDSLIAALKENRRG
jgi:hypothetical protein